MSWESSSKVNSSKLKIIKLRMHIPLLTKKIVRVKIHQNSKTPKTRDCHPKIKGCTRSWQFEFKSSLEHELHDKK